MSQEQLAQSLSFGASSLLLIVMVVAFYSYRVDNLRDRLFAIRDSLFLYAVDNELIESPAYQNLRLFMNGMIRYAHRVSMVRVIVLMATMKLAGVSIEMPAIYVEWEKETNRLPAEQGDKIRECHAQVLTLVAKHMILGSPLAWLAILIVLFHGLFTQPVLSTWKRAKVAAKESAHAQLLEAEVISSFCASR